MTPASSARCCCLGLVGNTNYMCFARGLDLDPPHCGDECPQRPDCIEQHEAMARGLDMPTDENAREVENEQPPAQALVILPFRTAQQAEEFTRLVMVNFGPDFATPIVTTGTAYEWLNSETGETGQVFELFPDAHWEAFIKEGNETHHILQRVTQEGTDEERTG